MEPALPPLHPKLPRLLEELDLKILDAVKWNVLLCRHKTAIEGDPLLILKFGSDERKSANLEYEVRILRDVLTTIAQENFDRLVLPEYVNDGEYDGLRWVLTKYVPGKHLLYEWSELSYKPEFIGGKAIGLEVARYSVDVLRDLRMVDVDDVPEFVRRFDFDRWLADFKIRSRELVSRGIFVPATVGKAEELFSSLATSRYQGNMFTNGDFYPRNFIILTKGKVAVADWVGGVDPWEFVAMKAWIMMWGNPAWQAAYIQEIKKHFPVDVEAMQVGLLVKAANRIWLWRDVPEEHIGFSRSQLLAYFNKCLDFKFVQSIFE
ncbi:MAG: hypothetical protein WCT10_00030 [Patescibacteria group bacterium]|jgi:hypothetical protein